MKKLLSLILCFTLLLPTAGLAETIYYLWDIPFQQSAREYADAVWKLKGLQMDVIYTDSDTDRAVLSPGQDATLFKQSFDLLYSHSGKYWESVTIDFPYFHIGKNDPSSQAFIEGITLSQNIWQGLITKYGSPDLVMIKRESDLASWESGDAPYISETKSLPLNNFQTLLQGTPTTIFSFYLDYDYPSAYKSMSIDVYFHNISVTTSVYDNGREVTDDFQARSNGLNMTVSVIYNWFISYPKESSDNRAQINAYTDTGF